MGRSDGAAVGDDRHDILRVDHRSDPFRVVGLVTEHKAVGGQEIVEQRPGEGTVVCLAGAQDEAVDRCADSTPIGTLMCGYCVTMRGQHSPPINITVTLVVCLRPGCAGEAGDTSDR